VTNSPLPQELSESRERRLRELRLLYQYTEKTCHTLDSHRNSGLEFWKDAAVQMAFTSDAVLYSMLALAAQHIISEDPSDAEARAASLEYLNLALPLHRRDIEHLTSENTDRAWMTGSLLRLSHFVRLQSRPLDPYTPPTQFLLQTRGSLDVIRLAVDQGFIHDHPNSITARTLARVPFARNWNLPALFTAANRQPLVHLLHRSAEHLASEPWSRAIQSAYEDTLSYLGAVELLKSSASNITDPPDSEVEGGQPPDLPFRRLVVFPTMAPEAFIQLVIEARPRALVVLAHYFAALAEFEDVWWVAKIGIREVRGLLTAVQSFSWEAEIVTKLLDTLDASRE
jgi:hypothetical protein